jgi:hypothetical protein
MGNRRFPWWAGPFVGAAIIPLTFWRGAALQGRGVESWVLAAGAAIGFVAGLFVAAVDYFEQRAPGRGAPNAVVTRVLIAISPLCFWVPFVGAVVTFSALYRCHWVDQADWVLLALNWMLLIGVGTSVVALIVALGDLGLF